MLWQPEFRTFRQNRFQRDLNRLWSGMLNVSPPAFPALNVWVNQDNVVVTAELPGLSADDLDISIVNDTVTLGGKRVIPAGDNINYHRRERNEGPFSRTLQFPFRIDSDNVQALFLNGVLQLTLPKAEADKPKKIAIKTTPAMA